MDPQKDTQYYRSYQPGKKDRKATPPPLPPAAVVEGAQGGFPALGATLPAYGVPLTSGRPADEALPHKRRSIKKWLKRILISLLILVVLAGGYVAVKFLINASKTFGGNLLGLVQNDKLDGEDQGRVNILLAGNSADDAGHAGGDLTDSIMLISLNTKDKTAFVVSIPRDLWVDIPGHGYSKINAAYVYGKSDKFSQSGYAVGGMGLLEKVVEQNFDVTINYYALVNYTALRQAVDAVGGVDVTIKSSDPRGLYDPSADYSTRKPYGPLVKLTNGTHTLNGQQALNLARARGDAYGSYGYGSSDFTRTANQRLLLAALKDKATSAGVATNPVRLGSLLDSIGNNVQTDFKTTEVRRLVTLSQQIPSSSITSVSLNSANGKNLLASYRTYNGQSALVPAAGVDDYSDITAYLDTLLTPPPASTSN